jgi:hypothetical protein
MLRNRDSMFLSRLNKFNDDTVNFDSTQLRFQPRPHTHRRWVSEFVTARFDSAHIPLRASEAGNKPSSQLQSNHIQWRDREHDHRSVRSRQHFNGSAARTSWAWKHAVTLRFETVQEDATSWRTQRDRITFTGTCVQAIRELSLLGLEGELEAFCSVEERR